MDVVEARDALAEFEDRTGIWLPAGELIFLERLPVRVDLVTAETGISVTASFMTVSGSELATRGSVLDTDVALVREGGEALIEDSLLAEPLRGEIRHVADRPGTNGVASSRYYIEIVAEGIPDELVGSNVKVLIPVAAQPARCWPSRPRPRGGRVTMAGRIARRGYDVATASEPGKDA